MDYVTSVERFALEEGRETAIRLLLRLLTHRFGEVPEELYIRLHTLMLAQPEQFMDLALISQSMATFAEQLPIDEEAV